MKKKLCSIEGCTGAYLCRGFCSSHYQKWRRTAYVPKPKRFCSVAGCKGKHAGRGFCLAHWQRWKKKSPVPMDAPFSKELHHKGRLNGRWKGGEIRDGQGRILIYCPGHPHPSYCGTHVYRYRLVMESALGRHLLPCEIVHHENGIVDDDRIENLVLMTQPEHARGHILKKINGRWSYKYDRCRSCQTTEVKHKGLGFCRICYNRKQHQNATSDCV